VFGLRPAERRDLDALVELARFLDSPNLPADPAFLSERLERSELAFAAPGPPSPEREYQFALEDAAGRVVGTSAILAKHGTPDMPHTFLRVGREARRSRTAGVVAEHVTLRLGNCADGPSELGALVLHPDARGKPGSPGKLLSWGRFAFIALYRASFESHVLAEMRAALGPEGRSAFWEAFGRRFTGMSYEEADRRSARDKQFILDLFPDTTFYASLLSESVAAQLGKVHPESLPAVELLERAGLRWIGEIDPFDAGPFYGGATDDVVPVRETRPGVLSPEEPGPGAAPMIVSAAAPHPFRAVATPVERAGEEIAIAKDAADRLELWAGARVATTPLPPSRRRHG
jgi:arginine N-succinyltransferase